MGRERNVQCAIACDCLFESFEIGCCLLVGIGGGHRKYVQIGDVVGSELVLDYEGARVEPRTKLRRPHQCEPDDNIYGDLMHFDPAQRKWQDVYRGAFAELRAAIPTTGDLPGGRKPEFHTGVILAGEKFMANGGLPRMRFEYHERVRAADMEGSGFASSCKKHRTPWLVFRGISDFGEKNRPKGMKLPAALAAATAVHTFLQYDYRPSKM
jgi:nucleoside phosphorylase